MLTFVGTLFYFMEIIMGSFYSGFGMHKKFEGTCENGSIYLHGKHVGYYDNGVIYDSNVMKIYRKELARYGNGSVYINGHHVASYHDGIVEEPYINSRKQFGSYDGDDAGAAALVLFLSTDSNKNYSMQDNTMNTDNGIIYKLFKIIGTIIGFIIKWIIMLIIGLVKYYILPFVLGATWLLFIMLFLSILCPSMITVIIFAVIQQWVIPTLFIPYYVTLICRRIKKKITTKEMYKQLLSWFLKGPFAYKGFFKTKNNK